jgi:uncharacterized protein
MACHRNSRRCCSQLARSFSQYLKMINKAQPVDRGEEPSSFIAFRHKLSEKLSILIPPKPSKVRGQATLLDCKIIHDAIWGTGELFPWEVAILDTPLIQRLRYIKQTGLAYLVYPSANHTRFDHTLGVLSAASQVFMKLYLGGKLNHMAAGTTLFQWNDAWKSFLAVRLAALLHDCGHSLLSHTGEKLYGKVSPFPDLLKEFKSNKRVDSGAGEIMSYFIATSSEMFEYITSLTFIQPQSLPSELTARMVADLLQDAGNYIVGCSTKAEDAFCADIVNGPVDADKLDYIRRDGHFAGINISYDLDRLLSQIGVEKVWSEDRDESLWKLVVPDKGVNSLEQIVISKFMLYSYIYYHPMVRAAELQMLALLKLYFRSQTPAHASDFLLYDDTWLRKFAEGEPRIMDVLNRRLLAKSVELNIRELKGLIEVSKDSPHRGKSLHFFNRLINGELLDPSSDALQELRGVITSEFRRRHKRTLKDHELIIDMPGRIKKDQFNRIVIHSPGADPVALADVFPVEAWEESYFHNRWRGYVFAPKEHMHIVLKAYRTWLESNGIKVSESADLGIPRTKRHGQARRLFEDSTP